MGKWQQLNREQALAARDFSKAGQTFVDYKGQLNEVLYSILTPLGYEVLVSAQALQHAGKHSIPPRYQTELSHLLNNPDFIFPNWEFRTTHLYYKAVENVFLVIAVHQKDDIHFVATLHKTRTVKGLREKLISHNDVLYIRGGFKWKKKWR
ncbi:MAG: hypothetical protein ACREOI_18005 [bacterium]